MLELAFLGDLWQDTIGGLWDSTDTLRTQYFDLSILSDDDWENARGTLEGFWETLQLSVIGGALALSWGLVLAVLRQLPGRAMAPVRGLTIAYIDVFRGIPLLLVLLVVSGSLGVLAVEDAIPKEIGAPGWFGKPDLFWYGIFALTLTYGAYAAQTYRGAIEAVPPGQMEAARSLGMSHRQSMRHVVAPQAVRRAAPPLLEDSIGLIKDTSLVSVIGFVEVVRFGRDVQLETFSSTALIFGALLFLLVTIPMARLADRLTARQPQRTTRGGGGVAEPAPAGAAGMGQTGGPV